VGNTPRCNSGKIGERPNAYKATAKQFGAIRRNQRQAPRLPRNEGVPGSSPGVGS
jgi:hypothetical protein